MFNVNTKRVVCHQYCMMALAFWYTGPSVFMSQVIHHRQWNVKPGNEFLRTQPCQVICNSLQKSPHNWSCEIIWFKDPHHNLLMENPHWFQRIFKVIDKTRWFDAGSMNRNHNIDRSGQGPGGGFVRAENITHYTEAAHLAPIIPTFSCTDHRSELE